MGAAISSILVCMVLMIFDVFIPCLDIKVMIIIISTYRKQQNFEGENFHGFHGFLVNYEIFPTNFNT